MKALGIDVGGSGIKGALVDLDKGKLLTDRLRIETPGGFDPESVKEGRGDKDPVKVLLPGQGQATDFLNPRHGRCITYDAGILPPPGTGINGDPRIMSIRMKHDPRGVSPVVIKRYWPRSQKKGYSDRLERIAQKMISRS